MATAKKSTTKRVTKKEATTSCGTKLKPGYKYLKRGNVVKVLPKKKSTKKGLGAAAKVCRRTNEDGSTTTYTAQGGSRPCPYGGNSLVPTGLGKRKPAKRKTTTKKR